MSTTPSGQVVAHSNKVLTLHTRNHTYMEHSCATAKHVFRSISWRSGLLKNQQSEEQYTARRCTFPKLYIMYINTSDVQTLWDERSRVHSCAYHEKVLLSQVDVCTRFTCTTLNNYTGIAK